MKAWLADNAGVHLERIFQNRTSFLLSDRLLLAAERPGPEKRLSLKALDGTVFRPKSLEIGVLQAPMVWLFMQLLI